MVNAKDIAEALGVSRSAVSIALNGKPGVSEQTRRMILRKAEEMGYVHHARGAGSGGILQMLVYADYLFTSIDDNSFLDQVTEGICTKAGMLGYELRVTYLTSDDLSSGIRSLQPGNCAGILLLASNAASVDRMFLDIGDIPIVLLDNPSLHLNLSSVNIANAQGIYLAVEHLFSLGHRNIAYLAPRSSSANFAERYNSFINSVSIHPEMAGSFGQIYLVEKGNYAEFIYGLLHALREEDQMPTAFVCATDWYAYACVNALRSLGLRVPEDVSVVGFDDIPLASMSSPPITSVKVPKQNLGASAVRLLDRMISQGREERLRISVLTELVERGSTGPVRI